MSLGSVVNLAQDTASSQTAPADSFTRIEDKFVVPLQHANKLFKLLFNHLELSYFDSGTQFTLIESLYFDSDHLDFYQHHFQQRDVRLKLRIRRYAPNGQWAQGTAFIEAKQKSNGVSKKERFTIGDHEVQRLKEGKTIELRPQIFIMNSKMDPGILTEKVEAVNAAITQYKLRPEVSIQYRRLAFEKNGLRVTVDTDIQAEISAAVDQSAVGEIKQQDIWANALAMKSRFSNAENVLCEIKHSGQRPKWFDEFMVGINVNETSFSKYCWIMTNVLDLSDK